MKNNLYLELTDRTKQIFKTVVESYLETGSPSGSETVLKRAGLDISSASVRNILSNIQKEAKICVFFLQTSHPSHLLFSATAHHCFQSFNGINENEIDDERIVDLIPGHKLTIENSGEKCWKVEFFYRYRM